MLFVKLTLFIMVPIVAVLVIISMFAICRHVDLGKGNWIAYPIVTIFSLLIVYGCYLNILSFINK